MEMLIRRDETREQYKGGRLRIRQKFDSNKNRDPGQLRLQPNNYVFSQ